MLEWSLHAMPAERQRHHPHQLMLQAIFKWSLIASLWFQPPIGTSAMQKEIVHSNLLQAMTPENTWCKNWRTTEKLKTPDSRPSLSNIYSDSLTTWVSAFKNASEFAAAICCGVSAFVVQLAETPVGFVSRRATTGHWLSHTAVVRLWLLWIFRSRQVGFPSASSRASAFLSVFLWGFRGHGSSAWRQRDQEKLQWWLSAVKGKGAEGMETHFSLVHSEVCFTALHWKQVSWEVVCICCHVLLCHCVYVVDSKFDAHLGLGSPLFGHLQARSRLAAEQLEVWNKENDIQR